MDINGNFDLRKYRDLLLKENYEYTPQEIEDGEDFSIEGVKPESFDLQDTIRTIVDKNGKEIIDPNSSGWGGLFLSYKMNDAEAFENNADEILFILGRNEKYKIPFQKFYRPILNKLEGNSEELEEMAKIAGDLKSSIESVIAANPELEGLALKKAIKGDAAVINALDGDDLYDNQLNKFIALTKGERELGQRGRKADPNKSAAEPKVKAEKSPKLRITDPTADEKPVNTSVFGGEENDAEDIADEMAAIRAAKGGKRLGTAAEKLAQITKEMKALIPAYQAAKGTAKEAAIVAQLKALTAEKKALETKVFKAPKALSAADLMGGEEA